MGTDAIDVDDDGDEDLLVVNLRAQSDSFYRNEGMQFIDESSAVGLGMVSRPFTRFGVGFVDFNNDGIVDLYLANGAVALPKGAPVAEDPYAEENLLLMGETDGSYVARIATCIAEVTPSTVSTGQL